MAENSKSKKGYDFGDSTGKIIAACLEVHKNLGPGFDEIFYQRALAKELLVLNLEYSREVWIDVHYKEMKLGRKRIDFVINDIMLEVKAKSQFDPEDFIQTLSYLKASGYKTGLLVNFGTKKLEVRRLVN